MTGRPVFTIYTDGGCDPNPGRGGWGAVIIDSSNQVRELSGGHLESTNNRMEITAAIMALADLPEPSIVKLYSDSQYLVRAIGGFVDGKKQTAWIDNWRRNGWTRREGRLENADLWQELDVLIGKHAVEAIWIRGHAGNKWNERCDQLASGHIYAKNPVPKLESVTSAIQDHGHSNGGGGILIIQYESPEQRDLIVKTLQAALRNGIIKIPFKISEE